MEGSRSAKGAAFWVHELARGLNQEAGVQPYEGTWCVEAHVAGVS
jgi:hypothetical protein